MTAPAVLFGVDVLDVRRVSRAIDYSGSAYVRHVTADGEPPLHPDGAVATAATVAVKEALIKAIGGRPPGFSWHDFLAGSDTDTLVPATAGRLLEDATPQLGRATDIVLTEHCSYRVRGASLDAALTRLGVADRDGASAVGSARWGRREETLVALAVLVTTTAKESA